MTHANEIAFGVHYLGEYVNRFKFPGHTEDFENATQSNARQQK